jgi:putative FmdB family regulatory protein
MPTYNYACNACGTGFQMRLSYAELDTAAPSCPDCGSADCQRGLSRISSNSGAGDYRLSRSDLETAIGLTGGHAHSHAAGGCAGCSGGSCSTCNH